MTWRRGLIRLWIVGSAAWAVYVYGFFKEGHTVTQEPFSAADWLGMAVVIVGASLAVLLAGLIIAWVLRRFRQ
jgi:hypothetical protein